MKEKLPYIALVISVIALLFGGVINASWVSKVNEAVLSAVVSSAGHGTLKPTDLRVRLSDELIERSKRAKFVPTFDRDSPRLAIEEALKFMEAMRAGEVVAHVEAIIAELSAPSGNDRDAARQWSALDPETKARIFALRTARRAQENFQSLSSEAMDVLIDQMQDRRARGDVGESLNPAEREAIRQIMVEVRDLENNPSKTKVLQVLSDELALLKLMAEEHRYFQGRLETELESADSTFSTSNAYIEFEVVFYNSGGKPESIHPFGVAAFQRASTGNSMVALNPVDSDGFVVISPGSSVRIKYRSESKESGELIRQLVSDYSTAQRDFVLSFMTLNKDVVKSQRSQFSKDVSKTVIERLRESAATMEL